jgi:antitoxin ParD1/3/4
MTSSLHVSLPDEMRAYVDIRANGTKTFATPSEYVRALIRDDMEKELECQYVFGELLKSMDDIKHGRLYSAEEVHQHMDAFLDELEQEDE